LDALARAYLGNAEITDRDRIAFALRELRKRGYDVEECDWTKALMICSLGDAEWESFARGPSKLYKRLNRIAQTSRLMTELDLDVFLTELYPESDLFDRTDFLRAPYEFHFKGDPELVEAVFQAVGFATRRGLHVPDDGSGDAPFPRGRTADHRERLARRGRSSLLDTRAFLKSELPTELALLDALRHAQYEDEAD
jgi:hypothetical protein